MAQPIPINYGACTKSTSDWWKVEHIMVESLVLHLRTNWPPCTDGIPVVASATSLSSTQFAPHLHQHHRCSVCSYKSQSEYHKTGSIWRFKILSTHAGCILDHDASCAVQFYTRQKKRCASVICVSHYEDQIPFDPAVCASIFLFDDLTNKCVRCSL